jgi:hypothetical protein
LYSKILRFFSPESQFLGRLILKESLSSPMCPCYTQLMADIVLATLNAKFPHASLGLRYLLANLGPLQGCCRMLEFDLDSRPADVAEQLLAEHPRIIGFGVYIWNVAEAAPLFSLLKHLSPQTVLVAGGPELADPTSWPALAQHADYVVVGEGDRVFAQLCGQILAGNPPPVKLLQPPSPDPTELQLPYALYSDEDLRHRTVYVESARGCPFQCEFCLSANDVPMRLFPVDQIVLQLDTLLRRGARHFKFVDRSLNLVPHHYRALLEFFLQHDLSQLLIHIEVVPDRLTQEQMALAARFPKGALQMEAGIQTLDAAVAERIQRRQNLDRLEANLRYLRQHTGVHLHADLIAGLPGETWDSFGAGFDRLAGWQPHEIQVGILKQLRGTAIHRHSAEWQMLFDPSPPYEVLQNRLLSFVQLQRLKRFARFWDLVSNRGRFNRSCRQLWHPSGSPFEQFMRFSDWLYHRLQRHHSISVSSLAESLFIYLTEVLHQSHAQAAALISEDLTAVGFSGLPPVIRNHLSASPSSLKLTPMQKGRTRQQRHQHSR